MKVLIIKLSSIGDVIHTLPSLSALRKGLGKKARIDWLVEEAASGILKNNQLIDNVIIAKRGWKKHLRDNLKTANYLAGQHYDMALDFQGLLKSGIWVYLSKAKRRVGFSNSRELSHIFLNEKLPPFDIEKHAVDRYLTLARHAGGLVEGADFSLNIPRASKDSGQKILQKNGVPKGSRFVVLIARARWETKLWDDRKFAELAKKVSENTGLIPVFVGSEGDRGALEKIKADSGAKAINLAGLTNLDELAAVLKLSSLVVTVDSGPMHLAAAAGAKIVALFGPTAPWRTGPYGSGHTIIRKGLKCSPCFKKKCSPVKCMDEITVDEVLAAVEGILKS